MVALFKNATRLASATRHEVCVWDYETAMPLYTLDMDAESLVLDPSEKFILVASGPEVVVLNSRDGSEHLRIDVCSKEVDAKVRVLMWALCAVCAPACVSVCVVCVRCGGWVGGVVFRCLVGKEEPVSLSLTPSPHPTTPATFPLCFRDRRSGACTSRLTATRCLWAPPGLAAPIC